MHNRFILAMSMLVFVLSINAQTNDSIKQVELGDITINGQSFKKKSQLNSSQSVDVAEKDFLDRHFSGNIMQALEYIPGVKSMDIGSGFSKPMIRGMGFNRLSVTENGVKQEGQQWGSDHGLEIDAFNVEQVTIRKGPSSLLYGSDAMGGVVEISQTPAPFEDQFFGEAALLGKSVNDMLGASVLLGIKKKNLYTKIRYSEKQYGDYRIPTDKIEYLSINIPIYGGKLKNTAGYDRSVNWYTEYRLRRYLSTYAVSNTYQKSGFFPGSHGIPDIDRVKDDGDSRNIDFPYSKVNHFKAISRQQYTWDKLQASLDLSYQKNDREEWSLFHTHYGTQKPPETDPNKELMFTLDTYASSLKLRTIGIDNLEYSFGADVQYQENRIGGYSFLLPKYNRFTSGVYGLATWKIADNLTASGGLRYDYGRVRVYEFLDSHLEAYLTENGEDPQVVDEYKWRSKSMSRNFGDFSGSVGLVWNSSNAHLIKANLGHSFRLPGVNELAANGIHHGTFRYEQGDPTLKSEKGWQIDASYSFDKEGIHFSVSPFASWFSNYIYLNPTGEWPQASLPHAGQTYRFTGVEALFSGAELSFGIDFLRHFNYSFAGEYVYTYNLDRKIALSFSPPASMRNTITWSNEQFRVYGELQSIASQNRVANNESKTKGANLIHLGANAKVPVGKTVLEINLSLRNLMDTKYYNHLSYYRKVEIPEPGRNFQLSIKIPFKSLLK
ncbi:TonB-dependent receptor [Dysgonomonas sp. Marseille-P4361]|uniref:TonB-dependent receptor n=1 Tax=Dysgonomonas sp. Marseille-P4361 TaxID=2161820 RepID=UPI0021017D47|nr:TonB-dependent receptor [Dysgonomonas sp. Marseille-P4361]